jgi:alkaline phosphatase
MQLIRGETGKNFNVIYGGGRKKFISENIISDEDGQRGQRGDGLDLIDEWLTTKNTPKAHYIHNRQGLNSMNHSYVEHVLGLFNSDHLKYHLDADENEPTLKEMTASAIKLMEKNPKGFVLFVEGGRIDHAHHENLARHALEETVQFSEAIRTATEVTDEKNTLVVVTSDHSHTLTLSGYSSRGKDILGEKKKSNSFEIDNTNILIL